MIRTATRSLLASALAFSAFMAAPAQAQEKGLGCMESRYTTDQLSQIAELGPQADIMAGGNPQADQLAQTAIGSAFQCAAANGWDDDQTRLAAFYELGRIMEGAFRSSDALSDAQLAKVDATLAKGDRTALWRTVESVMVPGLIGQEPQMSDADLLVLGTFAAELDEAPEDGFDEKVGILLGFMALQDYATREFAALQDAQ